MSTDPEPRTDTSGTARHDAPDDPHDDADAERERHARAFRADMSAYARARPGYPDATLDWLLPDGARDVVDLAAGAGALTRSLVARGLSVTAVEPSPTMRSELARAVPGVPVLDGTAETLPVADDSADAVLCAQAWHWVDPAAAGPEVARVLRPGGVLGLLWNSRDTTSGFGEELDRLLVPPTTFRHGSPDVSVEGSGTPEVGDRLGVPERGPDASWTQHLSADGLVDLVASRSYVIVLDEGERRRVLDAAADLGRRWAASTASGEVELPYTTMCWRAAPA